MHIFVLSTTNRFIQILKQKISHQMSEGNPVQKKDPRPEKKTLVTTLAQTVNPLMKELEQEQQSLQMPELALRCAQFFHSISQYCVGYYNNYVREEDIKKRKLIKKQEKEKDNRGLRRGKKKENKEEEEANPDLRLEPPKKPLTAYIIYFQDKKPLFVERYPSLNLSELTKLIAKEWKELSEAEKQVYLDRASEDRKRYEEQLAQFKAMYAKANGGKVIEVPEMKEDVPEDQQDLSAIINEPPNSQQADSKRSPDKQQEEQKLGQEANDEEQEDEGDMDVEEAEEIASGSGSQGERNGGKASASEDSSEEAEHEESGGQKSVEELDQDEK